MAMVMEDPAVLMPEIQRVPSAADELTPARIVAALDEYVIGQDAAKRAVAVALRNRMRRQRVTGPLKAEITPKNILLIGPTGVGKTELARRLADLVQAPFLKVDATKFTEVGYVGRNVDSMIGDLFEVALGQARAAAVLRERARAERAVANRLLDLLHPYPNRKARLAEADRPEPVPAEESLFSEGEIPSADTDEELYPQDTRARARLAVDLEAGLLEAQLVDIWVEEIDWSQVGASPRDLGLAESMAQMFTRFLPRKRRKKRMTVAEARTVLLEEEMGRAIKREALIQDARQRVEEHGIIFLDEIDKVAESERGPRDSRVSREGVQRDLLPLIEGTQVRTKHGIVKTDHILFIAAGAFHLAKPSALIPELQGRFPIRVELESLSAAEFAKILVEPNNALTQQYAALLETDGVALTFAPEGIVALAEFAVQLNAQLEDIGARRLHTLLERVLEDLSFAAPDQAPAAVCVDAAYVEARVGSLVRDPELGKYIL